MDARSRFLVLCVVVFCTTVMGCFDDRAPTAATITCRTKDDCPASFVCAEAVGRCIVAARFGDLCGDGALGGDEECDDGADNDDVRPDACRRDCRRARCGDGTVDTNEACDDGPANSDIVADACRTTCALPRCGDGVRDTDEACDEGSANSDVVLDACRTTCALPRCGDGVQDTDEGCDDGGDNNDVIAGACRTTCVAAGCGDGVKDVGEACDDGVFNSDVVADACRTTCVRPTCGDGQTDSGEACDDGNVEDGDGCRGDCEKIERCGDGVKDFGEACDDGNDNPADGCDACHSQAWNRDLVVSGSLEGRDATGFALAPEGIDVDDDGRVFIADPSNARVVRLDADGTITTVAGTGEQRFLTDGVRATSALLFLSDVAVDGRGRLLIADLDRVRRVDEDGRLTTIAGGSGAPDTGDGGPAIAAGFYGVDSVAVDDGGRIYVLDVVALRVRRIDLDGTITTVAGTGIDADTGDGGPARDAALSGAQSVSVGTGGELLITSSTRVRRVDRAGIITTVAGGGDGRGDGVSAFSAGLRDGSTLFFAVDATNRLLVSDTYGGRVIRLEPDGTLTTIAGNGDDDFAGDGGPAPDASLSLPAGIAVDRSGRVYIADSANDRIRRVELDGTITTVAGGGHAPPRAATSVALAPIVALAVDETGRIHTATAAGSYGVLGQVHRLDRDGTLTTEAGRSGTASALRVERPSGMAVDAAGRLYVSDDIRLVVERVELDGAVTLVAGGRYAFSTNGDGGPAIDAGFESAGALAFDADGRLLIVDGDRLRRIEADGTIVTVAGGGTGATGRGGDGGPATDAVLDSPRDVAVGVLGQIFIADTNRHRIRRIDVDGTITTVAGSGPTGFFDGSFSGDGGPATEARLDRPAGIAVDSAGRLFIADTGNGRLRRVDVDGTITTIAGTGAVGASGDGGPAVAASFGVVDKVDIDNDGTIFVADNGEPGPYASAAFGFVRRIDGNGVITTVAGGIDNDPVTFFGDGGPATAAGLARPMAVAIDDLDRLTIADADHDRIRRVEVDGTITTVAGSSPGSALGDGGPATEAHLSDPASITFDHDGRLVIYDTGNGRIRRVEHDGTIATMAGDGGPFTDIVDGTVATDVALGLNDPGSVAVDVDGGLLVTDDADTIVKIDADGGIGVVSTADRWCDLMALAVDHAGRIFINDGCDRRVVALDVDGSVTPVVAGGAFGDGLLATSARLFQATAAVRDASGRLVIVDGSSVRRVDNDGVITTIANDEGRRFDFEHFSGDGGPALHAALFTPRDVAVDEHGNVYVSDTGNKRVRRIAPDGTIDTVAGNGAPFFAGDGHPALTRRPRQIDGVAVDPQGRVVFVSREAAVITRVESDGTLTRLAGTGASGFSLDGAAATRTPISPTGPLVIDRSGRIFFSDVGSYVDPEEQYFQRGRIRCLGLDGAVTTVVGPPLVPGTSLDPSFAFSGTPASAFELDSLTGLAVDSHGRLVWSSEGLLWTLADDGTVGVIVEPRLNEFDFTRGMGPDGIRAESIALDGDDRIHVVSDNHTVVRRLESDGTFSIVAGTGVRGSSGDGGAATQADIDVSGIAVDGLGRLLIAEFTRIRRVDRDGTIATVAGSGEFATCRGDPRFDGGDALDATFDLRDNDQTLVADDAGNAFFLADGCGFSELRRVDVDGTLSTVVGEVHPLGPGPFAAAKLYASRALLTLPDGALLSVGDFGRALRLDPVTESVDVVVGYPDANPTAFAQARYAPLLDDARGVVFDPVARALVVTEHDSAALRVIGVDADGDGVVDDPALWTNTTVTTELAGPAGLAYDALTQTFVVADEDDACVRRLARDGTLRGTIVGRCGAPGSFAGFLDRPTNVAVSPTTGAIYVSDTDNQRVLRVQGDDVDVVLGDGSVSSAGQGRPARRFPVDAPGQLALDAHGNLYVTSTTTVRLVANVDGDGDADGDDLVTTIYGGESRTAFPESDSRCLQSLALSGDDVYVADACQGFVLRLSRSTTP